MYVCVHVLSAHVCVYVCVCLSVPACVCICMSVCLCARVRMCACMCIHLPVPESVCVAGAEVVRVGAGIPGQGAVPQKQGAAEPEEDRLSQRLLHLRLDPRALSGEWRWEEDTPRCLKTLEAVAGGELVS